MTTDRREVPLEFAENLATELSRQWPTITKHPDYQRRLDAGDAILGRMWHLLRDEPPHGRLIGDGAHDGTPDENPNDRTCIRLLLRAYKGRASISSWTGGLVGQFPSYYTTAAMSRPIEKIAAQVWRKILRPLIDTDAISDELGRQCLEDIERVHNRQRIERYRGLLTEAGVKHSIRMYDYWGGYLRDTAFPSVQARLHAWTVLDLAVSGAPTHVMTALLEHYVAHVRAAVGEDVFDPARGIVHTDAPYYARHSDTPPDTTFLPDIARQFIAILPSLAPSAPHPASIQAVPYLIDLAGWIPANYQGEYDLRPQGHSRSACVHVSVGVTNTCLWIEKIHPALAESLLSLYRDLRLNA
ncbi:hypothetical protein [Embleya sp. NBC_00896]|uniref:hypothetical protein n=1 Tax=Embleya sp. NBC_00896 TaxID=2975961 RepID=UPI00386CABA2|nr:hypothetical protein OG928_48310 [Embleya sp. NBC_00896]